jgi:hypothetical protein
VRTTVSLDEDVVAEVERLRRQRGLGMSEALNTLVREGIAASQVHSEQDFVQPTADLGLLIDVANIADVLDVLESS